MAKQKYYRRSDGLYEAIRVINGKRKAFRGKTQAEVERKMIVYQGEIERGRLFKVVADEWWDEHSEEISVNTRYGYRPALRRAVDEFGDSPIKGITPKQINAFLARFSKKYRSDKVCHTQLMILNLIFKHAIINGDIESNPADHVSVPKHLEKKKRELPADDQIELVKNGVHCQFGLFAYFLLYTGCRRGEALALTYGDIDRKNKLIHITKSLYWDNNEQTEAGVRDIILLDRLDKVLPRGKKDALLFPYSDGTYLSGTRFQKQWKIYCEESGVSVKDAQDLLGHSTAAMTQDIYTHLRNARKQQTASLLNQKLD